MIRRLNENVSTRIAAGEVIERPSSVAKELIENAIDAGARTVTIHTEQGGKSSFVIEDDGCGIAFDELPLALERYATSKIASIDDLDNIGTLGYRGEALASVAAVSRMEIRSVAAGSDRGGIIRCEAGRILMHTEMPVRRGTRIQIDDLFFNLPARRKFLKTGTGELRKIVSIINDYALIHPEITFRLYEANKKILEYNALASADDAVHRRFGRDAVIYSDALSSQNINVSMWWNPIADSRRVIITLFVNGRDVQESSVRAAVINADSAAYGEWVIMINMPLGDVDVNIHPTKAEVRFRRSGDVFKAVYACAKQVCAKRVGIHQPAFSENGNTSVNNEVHGWELYKKHAQHQECRVTDTGKTEQVIFTPQELEADGIGAESNGLSCKSFIGESGEGFLLFNFPNGIAIMDPHAAHERILYEEICRNFSETVSCQMLTLPQEIPEGAMAEAALHEKDLSELGFQIKNNMLLSVPAIQGKGHIAPVDMLRSALRGIEQEHDAAKRDREVWWRMARLACRNALKLGYAFERNEAEELLKNLEKCETPYTCPHGRPTLYIIENQKLFEMFER